MITIQIKEKKNLSAFTLKPNALIICRLRSTKIKKKHLFPFFYSQSHATQVTLMAGLLLPVSSDTKQINLLTSSTFTVAHSSSSDDPTATREPVSYVGAVFLPLRHRLVEKCAQIQTTRSLLFLHLFDLLVCALPPSGPGSLQVASLIMKNCLKKN